MKPDEPARDSKVDDDEESPECPGDSSSSDTHDSRSQKFDETDISKAEEIHLDETMGLIKKSESPQQELRSVGRYELREVLGEGGFGAVYLGFDSQLNRRVAIKVPHLHADSEQAQQEFLTEARQLAQLSHVGIVTVFDVGVDDGRCFIVSDYLDGPTLSDWLKAGQPWPECARIVALMADALAHAHANRT